MKQILQNLSDGETILVDVPCPQNLTGNLLIKSRNTLISMGTEKMLVEFGKANLLEKARQQPDKVKVTIDKIKADGFLTTVDAVRSKLDQPLPLGYCNAGVVTESKAEGFSVGDRVISNGYHAEMVRVPRNLCAKIPDEVDDESAAFTVLGAIGLQGIRLINPTLGESVVVFGLGIIGLMTIQMLKANGCRVLGVDVDPFRCELAREFGIDTVDINKEDLISAANIFSRGYGVDAVIITASTKSDSLVHQAAQMCRKRGRIVLVGIVGLNLRRDDFFEKEITFQVSASYGPGRYDPFYEEKGHDYPVGFVRWTEQRNFEAVLDMMANGVLNVKPLITHRYVIDNAVEAYKLLGDSSVLGILLEYPDEDQSYLQRSSVQLKEEEKGVHSPIDVVVGFAGAGNFASRILIPAFKASNAYLDTLASSGGVSGVHHGKKLGFNKTITDMNALWNSNDINVVAIVTQHYLHPAMVISGLKSNKNIFVEKPLALTVDELKEIDNVFQEVNKEKETPIRLMIGFNRRFSPHVKKMKSLLEKKAEPKAIVMTINAGEVPVNHWTQIDDVGGGRVIGECCHFVDLMRFLVGHKITSYQSMSFGNVSGIAMTKDKVSIGLSFADGSFGTIHYLANGGKIFPKERIEVFCGGAVLQMDNYRVLQGYGWPGFKKMKLYKQDKGHKACVQAFVDSLRQSKEPPIPYDQIMEVSRIAIEVSESLE